MELDLGNLPVGEKLRNILENYKQEILHDYRKEILKEVLNDLISELQQKVEELEK